MNMTEEGGQRRRPTRQSAEIVDPDKGKLLYEAVEGRHSGDGTAFGFAIVISALAAV